MVNFAVLSPIVHVTGESSLDSTLAGFDRGDYFLALLFLFCLLFLLLSVVVVR